MLVLRISLVQALALAFALASGAAHADAIHRGSISPLLQGWTIEPLDETGASLAAAITSDPDYPGVRAWEINDNSSSERLRYRVPGPTSQEQWTLRTKLRVVSGANPPNSASLIEVDNGSKRFLINFGLNTNGDLLVQTEGNTHVEPNVGSPASDYNTVELAYRLGIAHLFVNGVQIFGDLIGIAHAVTRVNFGSGTSTGQAVTRFAWVDWSVGEQACNDGIDNNRDGITDFAGGDSQCVSVRDPSEGVSPYLPTHVGDADPLDEGFRGTPPIGSAQAIQLPEPAWEIDDSSSTDSAFRYQLWPESTSAWEAAWSSGWTLNLRIGNPDLDSVNAASFVEVRRAEIRYSISFGVSGGQDEARLNGIVANAVICPDHLAQRDWTLSYDGADASLSSPGCGSADMVSEVAHPFEEGLSFGSGSVGSTNKTQFAKVELNFADADNDNLDTYGEIILGTAPNDNDSDDDLLLDGYEARYALNPLVADDTSLDPDNDNLTTLIEQIHQTDPLSSDTDGDQLSDGDEVNIHLTNPLLADTDGDGLSDGDEINQHQSNPLVTDTDDDGLSDFDEVTLWGTDPNNPDTDGDGRSDGIEVANNTNPLSAAETEILRQIIDKSGILSIFGNSVSIDGDFAVVGGGVSAGARLAIVYKRDGNGVWQEEETILQPADPPPVQGATRYAERVRISDERVLITANYEDVPAGNGGYIDWAGAAHIHEPESDGSWPRIEHLLVPNPATVQRFGFSGDINGDTAIVNTWRYDGFEASTIFFYERQPNGAWLAVDDQRLPTTQRVFSIDIDGDNALFHESGFDGRITSIYERSNGVWSRTSELGMSDDPNNEGTLSDNFVFIVDDNGVLRIHEKLGPGNWPVVKTFTIEDFDSNAGETANIGWVTGDGNRLVIENRVVGGENPLILFERDPIHGWTRTATLVRMAFDYSLVSIALSGSNLVVGEIGDLAWFMRLSDDFDGDGLTNLEEVNEYGSGPHLEDSDLDGLLDGDEVNTYGTSPTDQDTDDDTFSDGDEIVAGSNPLDPNSIPGSGGVLQIPVVPFMALLVFAIS
ncbi:MAG: binary toxin-like calcium binding domain-containing protein, partial [Pseudomonadota bacterium]